MFQVGGVEKQVTSVAMKSISSLYSEAAKILDSGLSVVTHRVLYYCRCSQKSTLIPCKTDLLASPVLVFEA